MEGIRNRTRLKSTNVENILVDEKDESKVTSTNRIVLSIPVLVLLIFAFRLFNSLTIKTFFQADEYYQSLEPAHAYVFGYGYITWEWKQHLRSSIHPWLYVIGYKIVSFFSDEPDIIALAPKVIGALLSTVGEVGLYRLAYTYTTDESLARITLLLSLLNPFNWYIFTRSFSNGFETVLIIWALNFWLWNNRINLKYASISFILALLSIVVRPTNAILWAYLGLYFLIHTKEKFSSLFKLGLVFLISLVGVLSLSTWLDYLFYGILTFPTYNFIEFNVLRNLSIFYGVAPWHFYIFQTIPLLLMTYLPFWLHSELCLHHYKDILTQIIIVVTTGFSIIGHKEFRFIYPLQPIFLIITSYSIKDILDKFSSRTIVKIIISIIIVINVAIAIFFSQVHERGSIDVINYLKKELTEGDKIESIGFLTPCHSTPWQSYIHNAELNNNSNTNNISKLWFLTCEPPLHLSESATLEDIRAYRDESDQFYDDRLQFLHDNFPTDQRNRIGESKYEWPSRLIVFEPEEEFMNDFLKPYSYHQCKRFFNSYFHWDDRRKGDIIVYCRDNDKSTI
ncbi:GPI mannosyltransferase 3 [Scheffersomyces amazonensis]|uniref:GPI mannosyltransferase 3 n=1 Tax=Scheffersomyces amazonensis TaxID=1078765 RepID=UPI00315CBEA1